MFPWLWNYGPAEWTSPLLVLGIVVIVHHLVRGKPIWLWVTSVAGSLAAGWLAHALGLGWFAATYFGSELNAGLVYAGIGLFWLTAEVGRDLTVNVMPRYWQFRRVWEHQRPQHGPRLSAEMKKKEFQAAIVAWNRENPRDVVIDPLRYQWSRSRRWWFLGWFSCWPVFAIDFLVWAIRQSPWEMLTWVLPWFVSIIKRPFIRGTEFTDEPPAYGPRPPDDFNNHFDEAPKDKKRQPEERR